MKNIQSIEDFLNEDKKQWVSLDIKNMDPLKVSLETLTKGRDQQRSVREMMDLFDAITNSKSYKRLSNKFFNFGTYKIVSEPTPLLKIDFHWKDILKECKKFMECLNFIKQFPLFSRISIYLTREVTEFKISVDDRPESLVVILNSPYNCNMTNIVKASIQVLKEWISNIGDDGAASEFFRWWVMEYLKNEFPSTFESAFVEWMKIADKEKAKQLYLEILENANNKEIKRLVTDLGTTEIIDHINQGIKEFNIDLGNLQKGHKLITRFEN